MPGWLSSRYEITIGNVSKPMRFIKINMNKGTRGNLVLAKISSQKEIPVKAGRQRRAAMVW